VRFGNLAAALERCIDHADMFTIVTIINFVKLNFWSLNAVGAYRCCQNYLNFPVLTILLSAGADCDFPPPAIQNADENYFHVQHKLIKNRLFTLFSYFESSSLQKKNRGEISLPLSLPSLFASPPPTLQALIPHWGGRGWGEKESEGGGRERVRRRAGESGRERERE
jgi:hypothetical protein